MLFLLKMTKRFDFDLAEMLFEQGRLVNVCKMDGGRPFCLPRKFKHPIDIKYENDCANPNDIS